MTSEERQAVARLARSVEIRRDIVERLQVRTKQLNDLTAEVTALNERRDALDTKADEDLALLKSL